MNPLLVLLTIYALIVALDIFSTKLAERYGGQESNILSRGKDGKMVLWRALVIYGICVSAGACLGKNDPWAAGAVLLLTALPGGFAIAGNLAIWNRGRRAR